MIVAASAASVPSSHVNRTPKNIYLPRVVTDQMHCKQTYAGSFKSDDWMLECAQNRRSSHRRESLSSITLRRCYVPVKETEGALTNAQDHQYPYFATLITCGCLTLGIIMLIMFGDSWMAALSGGRRLTEMTEWEAHTKLRGGEANADDDLTPWAHWTPWPHLLALWHYAIATHEGQ